MKQFFLSIAVICTLASCTQEEIAPRLTSVNDFGIEYGQLYDYQIEDPTTVLGTGQCSFISDTQIVVYADNGNEFTQEYVFVGESIRVFYDDAHWETLDYDATQSILIGEVTVDTFLTIFID